MKSISLLFLLLAFASSSFAQLSGPLSGTLGPGVFHVVDTISVEEEDSLTLLPGTTFTFDGPFPFRIYGTLLAEGTETDSIVFTTDTLANPDHWRGLRFSDTTSSASQLTYCTIENACARGSLQDYFGGGVYCRESSPQFANCIIRYNAANGFYGGQGGGLYFSGSSATLEGCTIRNNLATGYWGGRGGGIACHTSSLSLLNCIIDSNGSDVSGGGIYCVNSSALFFNCSFGYNHANVDSGSGGGIYLEDSYAELANCAVLANSANQGGGICSKSRSLAVFTYSSILGNWANGLGGGVHCETSSPSFENCIISGNAAREGGGGIYCYESDPSFALCHINGDTTIGIGGGVYCVRSSGANFMNCHINWCSASNGAGAYLTECSSSFLDCIFQGNTADCLGGGVYSISSSDSFAHCTISSNVASDGAGIYVGDSSSSNWINSTIVNNSASDSGGGVFCTSFSHPVLTKCTVSGNSAAIGGGFCVMNAWPAVSSTNITFSIGVGIYFESGANSSVRFCDVFGNGGGRVAFADNDPSHGPVGIAEVSMTNNNGDLCDQYYNIFLDPMFMDTAAGDFHLLAGSPCIDAGDPTLPHDPDSTIADIGAFYFHQSATEPIAVVLPTTFALYPNWPNPFNSTTVIRYDMPMAGSVSLTIYNLLGQRVATLFDGRQLTGSYTVSWNASDFPSGLYFCRMDAAGFAQTRKMVLLK